MGKREWKRRAFIGAVPAIATTALSACAKAPETISADNETLASDGGAPVRTSRLSSRYPGAEAYDQQERTEVVEVIEARSPFRYYGPAPTNKAAQFEREFASYMGTKYALGLTSGTASLHTALAALGVGPGDEVILPAWTWHACYTTIIMMGALPVFTEVDDSFTMDPADLEKKITPQTKVVMPVHFLGAPCDMDRILAVARKHKLKVLEDSAQCVGGQYKGKRLGSLGDAGIYSFQLNKMITAGEGGAVVTNDPLVYERAVRFHDYGALRPYHREVLGETRMPYFVGVNYRMNEMTAGVMRAQLRKLSSIVEKQRKNAAFVKERIADLPRIAFRKSNDPDGDIGATVDLLMPDKKTRDRFTAAMTAENVPMSRPTSAVPLPPEPYIVNKCVPHPAWPSFNSPRGKEIRYGAEACPRTLDLYDRAATLTIGAKYTASDLDDIARALRKVHKKVLA